MRHFRHRGNQLIKEIHGCFKGSSFWSCVSLGWQASPSLLWVVSPARLCPSARVPFAGRCTPTWPPGFLAFFCGLVQLSSAPMAALAALSLCSQALPGRAQRLSWFTVTHGHTRESPAEAHVVVGQEETCRPSRILFLFFLLLIFLFLLLFWFTRNFKFCT